MDTEWEYRVHLSVYFISETFQQISMKFVIGDLNKKLLYGILVLVYIYLI